MKLKVEDKVVVISGKYKGKKGKILKTFTKKDLVLVEGINIVTKHIKKTPQRPGEIVKTERPIAACKVMLLSPTGDKATRVGYKKEGGKKVRIAKKTKEVIDK